MTDHDLSFGARLLLSFSCFFRILSDAGFAARVLDARGATPALPPPPTIVPKEAAAPAVHPALQLLGLLQREGQLIDFLQQDVAGFSDADIGAAARVVHDRCAKALAAHAAIVPIRREEEGARVTVEAGFDASTVKLTGNVRGSAPFKGALRHRGWRVETFELPETVGVHDARVLAPAEVEL